MFTTACMFKALFVIS